MSGVMTIRLGQPIGMGAFLGHALGDIIDFA
jgi:hypothetical protein